MGDEITESELIYLQQCGINRIQQMNSIGIFTWRDLLNSDNNLIKQLPGVYNWHVNRWKLQAKLLLSNQTLILEKPPDPFKFIYYDIETDTQQNLVWLIGTYNPQKDEFKQFLAKNPKDEKKILIAFIDYLKEQTCDTLCSYSASWFDRRIMQKRLHYYSMECLPFKSRREVDLGLETQQMLLAKVQNYQLKTIGDFFKYPWKHKHDIDGFWVAFTYEAHQRDTTIKIDWNQLLDYNRDDVLVLPYIVQKMGKIYVENKFE